MNNTLIPAIDPVQHLKDQFGSAIQHSKVFANETTVIVQANAIVDVLGYLKSCEGLVYNFLSDISAVDYHPHDYGNAFDGDKKDFRPERFAVSYHIYSMLYNRHLRIKVFTAEETCAIPTVTGIWLNANWLEREIIDMMGIAFTDHPDPRRLLMPEDWEGHPHRRDYPLGYETVMFSFNVDEIKKHKPFAEK